MARTNLNLNSWNDWDQNPWSPQEHLHLETQQHVIKGEMLRAIISVTEYEKITMDIATSEVQIKHRMAVLIAEELLRSKFILFTKREEITGETHYLARAFIVPSDAVQLLKTVGIS